MEKLQLSNPLDTKSKELIVQTAIEFFESKPDGFSVTGFLDSVEYNNKTTWHYMKNRKWDEVKSTREGKEIFSSIKDRVFLKLAAAIGMETTSSWRHFNTDNFMFVCNKLDAMRANKLPGCIDGDTGAGKSYSIDRYRKEYPGNTYVVTCDGDMSVKDFVVSVAEAVGCETEGTKIDIRKRITKTLIRKDSPLLVIDEAENLKVGAYDGIKAMMDALKGICGIVLVGANDYEEKLKKLAERKKNSFPQIYSRLKQGHFERLMPFDDDDVTIICQQMGISNPEVVSYLAAICDNMRELEGCVSDLIDESLRTGRPIDFDMCKVLF
jgi:hypothetical protein